ncbi:membrane protein [Spirochaetia bacterium]|nr:membrane protein [Spirochaetia bacterium]
MTEDRELKVSFLSKKEYECPVCETVFRKEEMLSGGGRMIAGSLTEELHRLYEPSLKYGEVFPLAYQAVVCPECLFASMDADFSELPRESLDRASNDQEQRIRETELIFPGIDFHEPRGLMEGAASQYLVLRCYDFFDKNVSPTIKQGLAALRTAWLLDDLNKKYPQQHYDWLATLFRKKAEYLYNEALAREQNGTETLSGLKVFGPDTDKNYSYEGMLYLCAYLRYKYGASHNDAERTASLEDARRTIAKLFGMGKSSKDKPGAFLERARAIYDAINKDLTENDA